MRSVLTSSRLLLVALAAIIVLAGAGVGIWVASGGSGAARTSTASGGRPGGATLSHRTYALLYLAAIVRKSRISILKQWPARPTSTTPREARPVTSGGTSRSRSTTCASTTACSPTRRSNEAAGRAPPVALPDPADQAPGPVCKRRAARGAADQTGR